MIWIRGPPNSGASQEVPESCLTQVRLRFRSGFRRPVRGWLFSEQKNQINFVSLKVRLLPPLPNKKRRGKLENGGARQIWCCSPPPHFPWAGLFRQVRLVFGTISKVSQNGSLTCVFAVFPVVFGCVCACFCLFFLFAFFVFSSCFVSASFHAQTEKLNSEKHIFKISKLSNEQSTVFEVLWVFKVRGGGVRGRGMPG